MSEAITVLYGFALLPGAALFGIAVQPFIAPCYDRVRAPLLSLAQVALLLALLGSQCGEWPTAPFWLTLLALATALSGGVIAVRGGVPPAGREQVSGRR